MCSKLRPNCRGILLAGDENQLQPVQHISGIMGTLASKSLLEAWASTNAVKPILLTTSYRCNDHLLEYLQLSVYGNDLTSGLTTNISARLLNRYIFPQRDWPTAFLDCKGIESSDSTGSKYNLDEVDATMLLIQQLLHFEAASPSEIMIVSFYHGQIVALQEALLLEDGLDGVQVSSVDGVQGREQNIIILTSVRAAFQRLPDGQVLRPTNPTIGFIRDKR